MIWIFKILCIFEVLLTYTSNDAIAETKTKKEPTVASTAVNHLHRKCVGSRDSFPLFNQKSFIMLPTNDECAPVAPLAISAETVIQTITESDDPKNIREHLRCLMDSYLLQPEEEIVLPKGRVYCSFLTLDSILQMIERRAI